MSNNGLFSDLKIVELASVLAGPAVGMFFAELGATVIKVENPRTSGDITRKWKLPGEDAGAPVSAYFISTNWGKTSRLWDISTGEGRENLCAELADADVLLINFKPGDAAKYGLDYATLKTRFPKLIWAEITGYSETDPRPAFDLVLQAETGYMSMNGTSESGPLKMPVAMIDLLAAHQLKEGILAALYQRTKTGKGAHISVSLYESALASLANQGANYLVTGHVPSRIGSLHPNIAPYGETFQCSDNRFIVLAVGTDAQFRGLCGVIGKPGLSSDPKFQTNQARVQNRVALEREISPFMNRLPSEELSALFNKAGVPAAIIRDIGEALSSPAAVKLILESEWGKCLRTAVFRMKS